MLLLSATAPAQSFEKLVDLECAATGCAPNTPLVLASDGNLYGTTSEGGPADGFVYRIDPTGTLTVLAATRWPGQLIAASDGFLYLSAEEGARTVTVVASLLGSGASSPRMLLDASDGRLYGTTGGRPRDLARRGRLGSEPRTVQHPRDAPPCSQGTGVMVPRCGPR